MDEKKGGGGGTRKRKEGLTKGQSATMRPSRPQPAPAAAGGGTPAGDGDDGKGGKLTRSVSTKHNMPEKAKSAAQHIKRSISSKLNYRAADRQRKSVVETELYVPLYLYFIFIF